MKQFMAIAASLAILVGGVVASSQPAYAGGGGGGGGSTKPLEIRVTGYVTAIDYAKGTITVGASYYGNGNLIVNETTKLSLNNVSCDFVEIKLGDWAEARYDYYTKVATKISITRL